MRKAVIFILSILVFLPTGYIIHQKVKKHYQDIADDNRRLVIKKGVQDFFKKCANISSFESRRLCFKDDLIKMRNNNKNINNEYVFEINGKKYKADNFDEIDLIKIKRPPGYGFVKCSSNTFFFDWTEDSFYISLENPMGGAVCTTIQNQLVYILPKKFTELQNLEIKNSFKIKIR